MNKKTSNVTWHLTHATALLAAMLVAGCATDIGTTATDAAGVYRITTQSEYDAAKQKIYNGGDEILFARGRSFAGEFSLRRSDIRPDAVIRIADFGPSDQPRPVIRTDIEGMGVIDIRDSGGWTIENLELINESAARSERMGIHVFAMDSGFHKDFVVRNCLVHDITGEPGNKDNGGIIFRVRGNTVPTKFDNILLENNEVHDISGVGIRIKSPWEADPSDPRQGTNEIGRHAFQNVIVRGNRVSNITKNAIIVASADSPLVEYNVMGPNISTEVPGNSFFNFATDNALVQYNEAFGNTGPADDPDRGGFDADWNARNTVFQYNYSHDNNFAFAIMRRYHDGLRIHHNISENERYGFIYYGFPSENRISNIEVSNNTFYSKHPGMQLFVSVGRVRNPVNTSFVDNLFIFAAGGATWGAEPKPELGNIFDNNLVFGLDEDSYSDTIDDPLRAGSDADKPLHIFVLAGQSNMSGRGEVGDIDRTPHPRVLALSANDEWVVAVDPVHFDKPDRTGVGPGLAFAKEIAEQNPGIRVGLVPTAVGGSPIETWAPGGYHERTGLHPWDDAVHRIEVTGQAGEIKAVLWHQGEGDSSPARAPLYEDRLHDLIRRFRELVGDEHLPFIVGQLGQFKEWSDGRRVVNTAHENVPTKVPYTRFVSSDGLTDTDGTHFDAQSARELGRRYAEAYADIQQSTTP